MEKERAERYGQIPWPFITTIIFMDYKQAKMMAEIQKEFSKIQEDLWNIYIEAEFDGLVITLDWNGKILKVGFENISIIWNKEKLENAIFQSFNKGIRKVKEISTKQMQEILQKSGLNLPKKQKS